MIVITFGSFCLLLVKSLALVYKKVAFVHDISVVNLKVGWCLFACSMNFSMTSLLECQRERLCRQYNVSKPVACERFRM